MRVDYSIGEVAPYINWIYFFHAWGGSGMPQPDKRRLQAEAEERLARYADRYRPMPSSCWRMPAATATTLW